MRRTNYVGRSHLLRQDLISKDQLGEFAKKVAQLTDEGLNRRAISERLGVAYSTITSRLNKWKKLNAKTADQ